ncbi:MAG: PIN domain-containing protein [Deltaproteobacteria bacterium]|nr:PIN domain-containing protein [Deltaproteobacteria bacterium]
MSKIFVDTNILVYALDNQDKKKKRKSRALLLELRSSGLMVISTQVMQEFFVVATTKLGLEPLMAKDILRTLENSEVVTVDIDIIRDAIDCSVLNKISFWDALIVASAAAAKCAVLWSEDLNHGQLLQGVRVKNPFVEVTP